MSTLPDMKVQFIPSLEYITLLLSLEDTATNNPSCGDQQTLFQLPFGIVIAVQPVQYLEVISLFVPFEATATKIPSSDDQQTLCHELDNIPVVKVETQSVPFVEDITL